MELSKNKPSKRVKYAQIALVLCIFIPSFNFFINDILQFDLGMGSVTSLLYIILALVGLYSYKYISGINSRLIIVMAFIMLGLLISYILYPVISESFLSKDFNPLTSVFLYLPFIAFPMMIYTNYLLRDIQSLIKILRVPSIVMIFLALLDYYWTVILGGHYFDVSYMSFSYFMLPAVCFLFAYSLTNNKIIDAIVALVGLIAIFVVGSRACFLCGFLFCVMASIKRYSISIKKFIGYFVAVVVLLIIILNSFSSFTNVVMPYLNEHGATSRTLYKMETSTVDESDGRVALNKLMRKSLEENPLGYGLMGDRYIIEMNRNHGYAHSIIYEFLIDYGIIVGTIFFVALLLLLLRKHRYFFKYDSYYVLAAFTALGFIKLFFSGSYLTESFFWGLIGLLFNNRKNVA